MHTSEVLSVEMKTLTPVWTGDVDRDSGRPRESGLIGSLRFWYEGLLRSYGLRVCDATGEDRCIEPELCAACELFGATGRARRFRMEVDGLETAGVFFRLSRDVRNSSGNWLWNIFGGEETGGRKTKGAQGGWEFEIGVKALWSLTPFVLRFYPRVGEEETVVRRLALVLKKATELGGIGAKTQYGFGQVRIEQAQGLDELAKSAEESLEQQRRPNSARAGEFTVEPGRFFSILYRLAASPYQNAVDIGKPPVGYDQSYIPCAFDIRYKYSLRNPRTGQGADRGLRPEIRDRLGVRTARDVFGFVQASEARASRIHVSHLFREDANGPYYLKVWGDVLSKTEVVKAIDEHLKRRFSGIEQVRQL